MHSRLDTGERLVLLALAWGGGVVWQLQQAEVGRFGAAGWLLAAAAAGAVLLRRHALPCALALVLAGFASTDWRAAQRLEQALPAALEGRDLQLTGVVAALPQTDLLGTRFEFELESATLDGSPVAVPPRLALAWYRGFDGDALLAAPQVDLQPGQRWRFTARLRQPHGSLNPHGFDLELWLFERGLRASGSVRATAGDTPELLGSANGHAVDALRQRLRTAITARVPDSASAGVLAALVVGDQGAIDRPGWDLFRDTGVAHLMSISGLHVTMFAWLAAAVVGWLWRLSPRLMVWRPAPTAARWGGLLLAAAYALLAGWGVPAQRTLCMLAVVVLLRSVGRRWPGPLVLLAAGLAVSIADPWALLQPGFWLSFAAVGLLMAATPGTDGMPAAADRRGRVLAVLRAGLKTQLVATVGLAPLTLLFFQQVSLVGFVANLVAIPVVTLLITPLALAGCLLPLLWWPAGLLVPGLIAFLDLLAAWPLAVWTAAAAPAWSAAAGILGGALLVLPLPWRLRWLGLPLMLPLLWPLPDWPQEGRFELVAVDVGQGTAVLLRTRSHLLVYDSGPRFSPAADAGERMLLPLLRARGESRIDLLLLSHRDIDHVGGAASLLARMPVAAVYSSLEAGHPLLAGRTPHERCAAGQRWTWDGVTFDVLHPPPATLPAARPNTLSCVLRVQDSLGASVLLTADIEAAQEGALVIADAASLRSDALMVPHHGSRTSSSAAFLDAVAPGIAFVQAGYRSRFGHPAPDVMARYAARGIVVQRSDQCGAWTWTGHAGGVCEREVQRRYWHHRP